jgi:transcriptional regulator with PAS, ATPase and Fis domain
MPFSIWSGTAVEEAVFLRRLLDHVSDCLIAVDTNGYVVLINKPYCRLLGGTEEDFIGRHVTEVVSPHTHLHRVARGEEVVVAAPLDVRGHRLIARQVPVFEDDKIIGAVGLALFSDLDLLKKAFKLVTEPKVSVQRTKWAASSTENDILGSGPQFDELLTKLRVVASHAFPVLVEGETGTGKELAANAIHSLSARADGPFVAINCASIPENLVDAELFGYEAGAFTGARAQGKPGKFQLADGGTLFLDEIGDMPLHLQGSLLRALQTQCVIRVGGTAPLPVNVRVICATNKPLRQLVEAGRFRADLFYRLNVLNIRLLPLRERSDLEFLVRELYERLARREGLSARSLPEHAVRDYCRYSWPGNFRELETALLRSLILGETGLPVSSALHAAVPLEIDAGAESLNLHKHLTKEKQRLIQRALSVSEGDRDRAAALLGISRASFYRELKELRALSAEESKVPGI